MVMRATTSSRGRRKIVRRLTVLAAALLLALLAVVMASGALAAQTSPEVYDACLPGKVEIVAAELPEGAQDAPGQRIVNLERCPVGDRTIVDNGVGSVLPAPSEGIHAEATWTSGAQELEVWHRPDGTIELKHVGHDAAASADGVGGTLEAMATNPSACDDDTRSVSHLRWYGRLDWYFNRASTPNELTGDQAESAMRQAGSNVANAVNNCNMSSSLTASILYQGNTSDGAQINADNTCQSQDYKSVIGFGDLKGWVNDSGWDITLGLECTRWNYVATGYDDIVSSDVRVNKVEATWRMPGQSCNPDRPQYILEGLVTHERGHSFGLLDLEEDGNKYLTMSGRINGPCQNSESTLGRGDVNSMRTLY